MLFFCLLELPARLLQEGSWALHASFSKRAIMIQDQVKVETADWLSLLLPCFIYLFFESVDLEREHALHADGVGSG